MASTPAPSVPRSPRLASRYLLATTLLALAPVAALPSAANALIDVVAKRAAAWLNVALSAPMSNHVDPSPSPRPEEPVLALDTASTTAEGEGDLAHRGACCEPRGNPAARQNPQVTKPRVRAIYVGPEAVKSALPASARPSAVWTEGLASSPPGVRFTAVGGLASLVRVGDILIEAEGQRLHDFSELVAVVGRAYQRRSKTVVGRLWRGGEVWSVVVEPGW